MVRNLYKTFFQLLKKCGINGRQIASYQLKCGSTKIIAVCPKRK